MRPPSLKRLRSSYLKSFGVWMGILLHMVSSILDLQSSARHYLVNNSQCNCSAVFFHHP